MDASRIFICHAIRSENEKETKVFRYVTEVLQKAGMEIIAYKADDSEESIFQQLPTCQSFLLLQTPAIISAPRAQAVVKAAYKLFGQKDTYRLFRLGNVTVNRGSASLTFTNPTHENLLLTKSSFLITEESSNPAPNIPSPDQHAWRYFGTLSQSPNPKDPNHFSNFDYVQHLLAADPLLQKGEIPGGLSTWFYRDAQRVLASRMDNELANINGFLMKVYSDAKQLVNLSQTDLADPKNAPIFTDMVNNANNAYQGQLDPATSKRQGGATLIHDLMPQIATIDVKTFTSL